MVSTLRGMPIWRMVSLSRSNIRRKAAGSSAYPGTRSRISSRRSGRGASISAATRLTSRSRRSTRATLPVHLECLQRRDEFLDALVAGFERVLAEHRPLRLVVELEVHPVDGEVASALLG